MIIDFHTHTFPDKIASAAVKKLENFGDINSCADGTASGLLASMEAAGIDVSVVLPVATAERQVVSINNGAIRLREEFSGKGLFSFGAMHPDFSDWRAELRRLSENGVPGIKIHPDYQGVFFDDRRFMDIIYAASELGLTVVTHSGADIGIDPPVHCTPDRVLNVLRAVRPERLVLAHMGGWQMWKEAAQKLAGEKLMVDTSFVLAPHSHRNGEPVEMLDSGEFADLVRSFGAGKVLFGTDSPWADQREYVKRLGAAGLAPEELSAVMSENAREILKL